MVTALAREAYEPDTEVVDVDDNSAIARPRVPTEELTMQTMVNGDWHRLMPDHSVTSCGLEYHMAFAASRRESLEHRLCPVCFTAAEIARADAAFVKTHGLLWFRKQFGREPTFDLAWFREYFGKEPKQ